MPMLLDTRPNGTAADAAAVLAPERPAVRGPRATGLLLKRLLLGFWAMYFSIVAISNVIDLGNAFNVLHWKFLDSTNYPFMQSVIKVYGAGSGVDKALLVGAIALQIPGAVLFWRALVRRGPGRSALAMQALCWSAFVWTAFTFMTEFWLAYTVEAVFRDLLVITIATALVELLVPDRAPAA